MSFPALVRRIVDGHPIAEPFTASEVAFAVMEADRTLRIHSSTRSRALIQLRRLEADGIVEAEGGRGPSGIRWRRIA